jgi:hypothetical protein
MLYLISGNGEPNFGDELIALNWIKYYRDRGYEGEIFLDCKSSAGARTLLGEIPGVRFGRFLKRLATGKGGEIHHHVSSGRSFVDYHLGFDDDYPVPSMENDDCPQDLRATKLVHLIGGGYINGVWTNSFAIIGGASQFARRLQCPVVATGLGVAPLDLSSEADRSAVQAALSDFSFFEVRDSRSRDLLIDNLTSVDALREGLDDSFLFAPNTHPMSEGRSLHLCLFGRHLEGDSGAALLESIRDLSRAFDKTLFWRCNRADEGAAEMIERAVDGLVRVYNRRLLYRGLPVGPDDFMVTSRFHPHLLAARAGIEGRFLVHSQFYESKHASVCGLGSPFVRYDGGEIKASESSTGRMRLLDPIRIAAKRRVADEIVSLLGQ